MSEPEAIRKCSEPLSIAASIGLLAAGGGMLHPCLPPEAAFCEINIKMRSAPWHAERMDYIIGWKLPIF
jgi:hypothetical protein